MNHVALAGCGNMGKAILKALLKTNDIHKISVIQPSLSAQSLFADHPRATFYADASLMPLGSKPEALILAFKPQELKAALEPLRPLFPDTQVISLLAGTPIDKLRTLIGPKTPCMRLMPNVGVQIGQGASLAHWPGVHPTQERQKIETLFSQTGKLFWVSSEELLDSLTAISGCGPAYFFLVAEILTNLANGLGLEKVHARALVQQTLLGSALITSPQDPFTHLISTVASKGGVTEAALKILEPGLTDLFERAIDGAHRRIADLVSKEERL